MSPDGETTTVPFRIVHGVQCIGRRRVFVPPIVSVTVMLACMIADGVIVARLAGVSVAQSRSLTAEIGVHNIALAIYLSLSYLESEAYTIIPVAYLIVMYLVIPGYIWVARKR